MNNIEVGEYVRTEGGYIGKLVEYIPNALNYLKIDVGREIIHSDNSRDNFIYTRYGFQLKHSSNLIDLIEEGDYVNNCRVVEHAYQKGRLFVTYLYIGGKVITTFEDYSWELTKDNEDMIKSIVTKEQFESVSYKVEE